MKTDNVSQNPIKETGKSQELRLTGDVNKDKLFHVITIAYTWHRHTHLKHVNQSALSAKEIY